MKSSDGNGRCRVQPGNGVDQLTICSVHCGARCCKYITIQISAPISQADWSEVRWWLLHEGIAVVKDDDGWMVVVQTRCQNLLPNNYCAAYPHHPDTCKDYDPTNCEYTDEVEFKVCLTCEDDLATYLDKQNVKRGRRVAATIRRAQRVTRKNSVPRRRFAHGLLPLLSRA